MAKDITSSMMNPSFPGINYWIDGLIEGNNKMAVKGWAYQEGSRNIPKVRVKEGTIREIRQERPDVVKQFDLDLENNMIGFEIEYSLDDKYGGILEITDDNGKTYEVALKPVSNGVGKIKYYKGLIDEFGYEGAYDFIKKKKNRNWIGYDNWYQKEEKRRDALPEPELEYQPKISICMPVYNIEPQYLRQAIDSVLNQTYQNWELCIADDCSTKPWIQSILRRYIDKDDRIKVKVRLENGNISEATNTALSFATGDYVAFMDNDDLLSPHTLMEYVKAINEHPDGDVFYCDEDKVNEGNFHFDPLIKPNWNSRLLYSCNYITHFVMMRYGIANKIGGLRTKTNGAQDYDYLLRASTYTDKFVRIPELLYSWRVVEGSAAGGLDEKNYAYPAGKEALSDLVYGLGVEGEAEIGPYKGSYKVKRTDNPSVSIILPLNYVDHESSYETLDALARITDYPNYEILAFNFDEEKARKMYPETDFSKVRFVTTLPQVPYEDYREGASQSESDYLVIVRPGVIPESGDWLQGMVNETIFEETGMVTPMYLYPDDTIMSAGHYYDRIARDVYYPGRHFTKNNVGYFFRTSLPQNVESNYTQCYLIDRNDFLELNLRENYHEPLAGVELGEKIRNYGKKVVMTPDAKMYWHGHKHDEPYEEPMVDTEIYEDIIPYENYEFLGAYPELSYYSNDIVLRNQRRKDNHYKGLWSEAAVDQQFEEL